MKATYLSYSPSELAWIKRHRATPRREAHAAFCDTFSRTDVSHDNFAALCTRKGWATGRTGCFPKGHAPANRGKTMPCHPNSAKTQFKKGGLPHNTKYLGHDRVTVDGYVEISIADTNPHTGFSRRYVLKHKHLWETLHGPVPAGHVLKCLGDRLNSDPSNWEMIPRSVLQMLNHRTRTIDYDDAPPELKPTILAVAKLKSLRCAKAREAT